MDRVTLTIDSPQFGAGRRGHRCGRAVLEQVPVTLHQEHPIARVRVAHHS